MRRQREKKRPLTVPYKCGKMELSRNQRTAGRSAKGVLHIRGSASSNSITS